ncbi:MAG: hypothetical protein M3138_09465, partial [Actinomycetota bacterium]|nr:hypothetical protein [Actinomycetota bacterium]
WGQNAHGQLGRSTPDADGDSVMDPSTAPITVRYDADPGPLQNLQDLSGIKAISAGQFHTCTRMTGGSARCFGNNKRGQLGTDPDPLSPGLQNSSSAVEVSGLAGAGAVTAGGFHSCAIVGSGVMCWGYNFYGQLGFRAPFSRIPVQVTTLTGATAVTAGTRFACALTDADTPSKPVCWGSNADGRLGAGIGVPDSTIRVALSGVPSASSIDAGNGHACVLAAGSNAPRCWGFNGTGQVGDSSTTSRSAPVPVFGLSSASSISAGGGLGAVERGHSCAELSDGKVRCWGRNLNGQLGDTTTMDRNAPVTVQADVDPSSTSENLVDLTGASDVVTGGFHSCALTSGTVWCWGFNGSGQLGDNTTSQRNWAVHVQKDTDQDVDDPLVGVVALTAGDQHTCALIKDGSISCWGENGSGQLGDTTNADRSLPTAVATIGPASRAEVITAGDFHTCARLADGSMKCWGANGDGQLGDGTTLNSATPKLVAPSAHGLDFGPTDGDVPTEVRPVIRSISASRRNTCSAVLDTTVYCWGDNTHGQLGDGVGPTSVAPVAVSGLAGSV